MRQLAWIVVTGVVAVAVLAGCGGGTEDGPEAEPTTATLKQQGSEDETIALGAEVFASAGCGGCHTLEAAGSTGTEGPNLDEHLQEDDAHASLDAVMQQIAKGGNGMPPFENRLTREEIRAVATYVIHSAERHE